MTRTALRTEKNLERIRASYPEANVWALPGELVWFHWWNGATSLEGEQQGNHLERLSARDTLMKGCLICCWLGLTVLSACLVRAQTPRLQSQVLGGDRDVSPTATTGIHCRWAVVKICSPDTWAASKKVFHTSETHTVFAWVTFTSGDWEGIPSGHGGMYKHPSWYFSYQWEKKCFQSTQMGHFLVELDQLQYNSHI